MRVLLLTHDTTAPPSLLTAVAARGHEIRAAAGKPADAGSESCGVVLVCGAVLLFARRAELVDGFPRIADYLAALEARPARQRAMAVGAS